MLEGERSYQRGQENLVPSNNAPSAPESPVNPKAQENPWYIQHFTKLLIGFGLGGGAVAILLLWMLWLLCGMSSGSSDQLRLHLLYVTGGIIAVLTLLQTNWKNQGDRLKIDADIKKNEQDAEKNERDHIRQVHAERRSRYTKAVEQLADEKATVRLGGIYTLVGLVDEWLADDSFKEESDRHKEGQVIVNSLCSYIRSPFPLALKAEMIEGDSEPDNYEGDFSKDQAAFREEQDVRRTIFVEMSKRSSTLTRDEIGAVIDTFPGMWSDFEFDFSRAPIFYTLSNLTIEKANFSFSSFYGDANFNRTIFTEDANFDRANFTQNSHFSFTTFRKNADFFQTNFAQNTHFTGAIFTQNTNFHDVNFIQDADFLKAIFTQKTSFAGATFTQNATFHGANFTQNVSFRDTTFTQNVSFRDTTFTQNVNFRGATFRQNANFRDTTFTQKSNFLNVTFTQNVYFVKTYFKNYDPVFSSGSFRAQFSALLCPDDYLFSVHENGKPIRVGRATLLDKPFNIPIGTVLFDPDSWEEEKQEYTHISEPAKPLDNLGDGEEGKSA